MDGKTGKDQITKESHRRRRISTEISSSSYDRLQATFKPYELKVSEALRIGIYLAAAAVPVLARGGELVLRDKNGKERAYTFSSQ